METAIQETNHQSSGVASRVWERIARQLESSLVVDKWNEAILRIAREARPASTPEELTRAVARWRILTEGMGVAASAVDMVLAAAATGIGINTLAGMWRFRPIDPDTTPNLFKEFAGGRAPAAQWRRQAFRQTAYGLPWFGAAAGVVAARPARVGLTFAGEAAGAAGEKVTRIVRRIVSGTNAASGATNTVYYGMGKP